MPERLRVHRAGIDRLLQHVVAGVIGDDETASVDRDELWTLLDALPIAVLISADRECSRILGNTAARRLYQLPEGQNFSRTASADELPPFEIFSGGRPAAPDDLPLQKAAKTGQPVARSECEIRFYDGRRIFIAGHCIPIRDRSGQVRGSIGAFLDLTPQHRELELSQALAQEMSHRLKNTLAIVQAISRQTVKPFVERDVFEAFESRLILLSKQQDLLQQGDWKSLTVLQVIELTLESLAVDRIKQVSVSGPEISISSSAALTLSMILHELATNSLKYGALRGPPGRIEVTWNATGQGGPEHIKFTWREAGGPPVHEPTNCGFGMTMIASIARALPKGSVDLAFLPSGLSVCLRFTSDLNHQAAVPGAGL